MLENILVLKSPAQGKVTVNANHDLGLEFEDYVEPVRVICLLFF